MPPVEPLLQVSACIVHPVALQFQLLCGCTVNCGAHSSTEMHAPSFSESQTSASYPARSMGKIPSIKTLSKATGRDCSAWHLLPLPVPGALTEDIAKRNSSACGPKATQQKHLCQDMQLNPCFKRQDLLDRVLRNKRQHWKLWQLVHMPGQQMLNCSYLYSRGAGLCPKHRVTNRNLSQLSYHCSAPSA